MAEQDKKNTLSAEEVLKTEIIVNQALIDLLIAKHIISEEELVRYIKNIRLERQKMIRDSDKIITLKK